MASSHFGLSRVPRPSNAPLGPEEGPGVGSYSLPGAMSDSRPGYVAFGGGGRSVNVSKLAGEEPGPGNYDLSINLAKDAGGSLRSKTIRWEKFGDLGDSAGPQTYVLPSTVKSGRPKKFKRPGINIGMDLSMGSIRSNVPSIPTRHQASGYEESSDGNLKLQDPVEPGFTGYKENAVGPGDYEPRIDVKFRHAPTVSMKGSDRNQLYRSMEKAGGQAPGPGYYNQRGDFDKFDNSDDTNYIVRLNAGKKQLSASFASGTTRNAMLNAELKPKIGNPGPGAYSLRPDEPEEDPNSPKKKTDQNFLSGGERFPQEKRPKDNPNVKKPLLKSDFDQNKINILRSKKLKARSGWAQHISFDSTESRFFRPTQQEMVVPSPGAYTPKNEFASLIKNRNERAPGFGSSTGRDFKESNANKRVMTAQEELMRELEADMRHGVGPGNMTAKVKGGSSTDSHGNRSRPAGIGAAFGSGVKENRFGKSLEPVGPPPGAYNTIPSWSSNSCVKMQTSGIQSRKPLGEVRPGPGDYVLPSTMAIPKGARSEVMISTAKREGVSSGPVQGTTGPGPGSYSVAAPLVRKTYNILLAPE